MLNIQAELWVENKVWLLCWHSFWIANRTGLRWRFKSRDESKPEMVDSWLSGPKWTHSHIRAEPVLAPIWLKSHGGDGADIEPVPEKNFEQSWSWFPSWRWVGVDVREGVSLLQRKQELMTKKTMRGVWVASEWNQPDNCWRRASIKLLESVLRTEVGEENWDEEV